MQTSLPTEPTRSPPPPGRPRRQKQPQAWSTLPPVRIAAPRQSTRALPSVGVVGSGILHALVALLIFYLAQQPKTFVPQVPVEFDVVTKPPPPPPPPPEPPKPPEEPKKVEPPKVAKAARLPPPPKDAPPPPPKAAEPTPPPPPNEPPPPDAKPSAPVMIGISMSSTTAAGGFAAPVGNTLYGSAPKVAPRPEEVKPYAAPETKPGRYVPPYKVTRLPELASEFKAAYPEEARKLELEGQVTLRLTIDAEGKVAKAVIIKGAGNGFDEAALDAVKRFRFKPGTEGNEAVTTEITYTYTFLLD